MLQELESRIGDATKDAASALAGSTVTFSFLEIGRAGRTITMVDNSLVRTPFTDEMHELTDLMEKHRALGNDDGRRWYVATVRIEDADVALSFEYDRPPPPWDVYFRVEGAYLDELARFPRPPSAVQGWMKVELASLGFWDLVADEPRFNQDFEATGTPQTPESVGVEPPPGAEYAIAQPLPHHDLDAMNRLAIAYAEEEERQTGVFPPDMVEFRRDWGG